MQVRGIVAGLIAVVVAGGTEQCARGVTVIDFNDITANGLYVSVPADHYQSEGMLFATDFQVNNMNYEAGWWPPIAEGLGASLPNSLDIGDSNNVADIHFVVPGTSSPATTDRFGALFMNSEVGSLLARIEAFDATGTLLTSVTSNTPASMGAVVEVTAPGISRVRVSSASNGADVDNLYFNDLTPVTGAACTGEVYLATAGMKGVAQIAPNVVVKGTLANRHLINFALGLPHSEKPAPTNMVLALVSSCQCSSQSVWLVVWNKQTSQIAATIASAQDVMGDGKFLRSADTGKAGQGVVLMNVQKVGNLNGGYMTLVMKYSPPSSGCISKETASLTGYLNVNAYDPNGNWINGMEILLISGTITVKTPSLGTAVVD